MMALLQEGSRSLRRNLAQVLEQNGSVMPGMKLMTHRRHGLSKATDAIPKNPARNRGQQRDSRTERLLKTGTQPLYPNAWYSEVDATILQRRSYAE